MGLLIVIGAIVVIVGPLVWLLSQSRSRTGETQMALLGAAAGEAELATWVDTLRSAGIVARVQNVGDFPSYGTTPYSYEIWVRTRDEARAREALGL